MDSSAEESDQEKFDTVKFFHDEEFEKRYPGVRIPPPSFIESGAKIISYERNKNLTVEFQVSDKQANPLGYLQGGILCSFFDDVFGPLSFASMRKPCVSIDITVHFIRPVKPGEVVRIRAEFKSKSRTLLQLYAEARNIKQKLAATATSSMMVYEP